MDWDETLRRGANSTVNKSTFNKRTLKWLIPCAGLGLAMAWIGLCESGGKRLFAQVAASPADNSAHERGPGLLVSDAWTPSSLTVTAISWTHTAEQYRQDTHHDRVFYCSGGGTPGALWGSDVYSDQSSICTAAVHAGLITAEDGGAIAIRLLPGQDEYNGTAQNAIASQSSGRGEGSFTFTTLHDPVAGVVTVGDEQVPIQVISWDTTAQVYQARVGEAIAVYCPPGGDLASVWGDPNYRAEFSICSAAVHSNQLSQDDGGTVVIEMSRDRTETSFQFRDQSL